MNKIIKNKDLIVLIIIGVAVVFTSVYYAASIYWLSENTGYDNSSSRLNSTVVQNGLDELYYRSDCNSPLNLGDYFTLVPDASTYTIYKSATGYSSDQTITPNELTLWRVISKNGDGSVDAVSEYVSSTNVYFSNYTGYANYIGTMQSIATQYAKVGYTINTRMMGYGGQTLLIPSCSNSSYCTGDGQSTTTFAFNGSTNTKLIPESLDNNPTTGTGQEYLNGVGGDTLYLRDIQLVGNVYKTDTSTYTATGLKAYNPSGVAKDYYLASRKYYTFRSTSSMFYFHNRRVTTSGAINLGGTYGNSMRSYSDDCGTYGSTQWCSSPVYLPVRPIITLRSGITIASGAGTKASPYILN